jgi:hypothetical protein
VWDMLRIGMPSGNYRLVVEGELGPRYSSAFDGMTVHVTDGETEIVGPIIDPAHLLGLIERIAGLGLTLSSVSRLETQSGAAERLSDEQS